MPRVCPAINASRANPREQITGGRQGKSEREGGQTERERVKGKRPTETHRIALQLGREIALSTVLPRGLRTAGLQTIVKPFRAATRRRERILGISTRSSSSFSSSSCSKEGGSYESNFQSGF